MRFAEAQGLRRVAFGPVANPSKAALMPRVVPFVLRFYSRYRPVRRAIGAIVPHSAPGADRVRRRYGRRISGPLNPCPVSTN